MGRSCRGLKTACDVRTTLTHLRAHGEAELLSRRSAINLPTVQKKRASDATSNRVQATKWASKPVSPIGRLSNLPATSDHQ